jgi:hypothetical protein
MPGPLRPSMPALLILTLLAAGISGCASNRSDRRDDLAPLDSMPPAVREAPAAVQEAYRFAAARPDLLQQVPCYCGCDAIGHTSNDACFFADDGAGGRSFDAHALGCSICVDIARDVQRMNRQGLEIAEIRAAIDDTYARYGPSNQPLPPVGAGSGQ